MLAIKNNLMAENAARHLGRSYDALAESIERLSSGLRIGSAKDDAAGLAVRELIRADVAVLRQASRNALDGISMVQSAEGAMAAIDEILVRMKELAEQAATASYDSDQLEIMDLEFQELMNEITRIASTTAFNSITLLDGNESYDIHVGSSDYKITVAGGDVTASGLGLAGTKTTGTYKTWQIDPTDTTWVQLGAGEGGVVTFTFEGQANIPVTLTESTDYSMSTLKDAINAESRSAADYNAADLIYDAQTGMWTLRVSAKSGGGDNDLSITNTTGSTLLDQANWALSQGSGTAQQIDTAAHAETALTKLNEAIESKDKTRAAFGYMMNRMEAAVTVLDIQAENLLAAESRISDVDVATEMAAMTRNQVLAQAGISMLAQASVMPQMALSLLG